MTENGRELGDRYDYAKGEAAAHGFSDELVAILDATAVDGPDPAPATQVHRREFIGGSLGEEASTAYGSEKAATAYELHGAGLAAWDASEDFARWVLARAGLRFEPDARQEWKVMDSVVRVSLWAIDERGYFVVRVHEDWPDPPAPKSLDLTAIFMINTCGKLRRETRGERSPEHARWKRRALVEAELVPPASVNLRQLPASAPPSAATTWALIREFLRVRWLTDRADPVPLSVPFLCDWFSGRDGAADSVLVPGKRWLEEHGFIEHVADAPGRFGKPLFLWRVAEDDAA